MQAYTVPLLEKHEENSHITSFLFDRKAALFPFVAGQFLKITLPEIQDPRGTSRFFSIASSPTEKTHLLITTTISESPFKQSLARTTIGQELSIMAPFGKFTLPSETAKTYIFLGGGIGITPFRSMIRFAADTNSGHRIILLYSSKNQEELMYQKEFETIAQQYQSFIYVPTITRPEESTTPWNGRIGRIDEILIREYTKELPNTVFYVCGPPGMVTALAALVTPLGLSNEQLKTELFTGYQ